MRFGDLRRYKKCGRGEIKEGAYNVKMYLGLMEIVSGLVSGRGGVKYIAKEVWVQYPKLPPGGGRFLKKKKGEVDVG